MTSKILIVIATSIINYQCDIIIVRIFSPFLKKKTTENMTKHYRMTFNIQMIMIVSSHARELHLLCHVVNTSAVIDGAQMG